MYINKNCQTMNEIGIISCKDSALNIQEFPSINAHTQTQTHTYRREYVSTTKIDTHTDMCVCISSSAYVVFIVVKIKKNVILYNSYKCTFSYASETLISHLE